jgi:hypothetical protein
MSTFALIFFDHHVASQEEVDFQKFARFFNSPRETPSGPG